MAAAHMASVIRGLEESLTLSSVRRIAKKKKKEKQEGVEKSAPILKKKNSSQLMESMAASLDDIASPSDEANVRKAPVRRQRVHPVQNDANTTKRSRNESRKDGISQRNSVQNLGTKNDVRTARRSRSAPTLLKSDEGVKLPSTKPIYTVKKPKVELERPARDCSALLEKCEAGPVLRNRPKSALDRLSKNIVSPPTRRPRSEPKQCVPADFYKDAASAAESVLAAQVRLHDIEKANLARDNSSLKARLADGRDRVETEIKGKWLLRLKLMEDAVRKERQLRRDVQRELEDLKATLRSPADAASALAPAPSSATVAEDDATQNSPQRTSRRVKFVDDDHART